MQEKGKSELRKMAEKAAGVMELPPLFSESELRVSPSEGIRICGIRETRAFSSDYIVFLLRECELHLHGVNLNVACCENGMAILHGTVLEISFCGGEMFVC